MNTHTAFHPYQHLSERQRAQLPELTGFKALPVKFEDSTNQLWLVDYEDEGRSAEGILKLCHPDDIKHSVFWQGMTGVFGVRFPEQMADYAKVYELISQWSPLQIPQLISAVSSEKGSRGGLLAEKLSGNELQSEPVTKDIAAQLGHHLGALHQQNSKQFGVLFAPEYAAEHWGETLHATILQLAQRQRVSIDNHRVELDAFKQGWLECPGTFVPIMPDLRWDQFLVHQQRLHALVDLDAMVWGARELEFVLLEYLLDEVLWGAFTSAYAQHQSLPDLNPVRTPYRLLLFFMNVLGEESLEAWMSAPSRL